MAGFLGKDLLKNEYWLLRHGRSIPNEMGIIVSSLSNGESPKYGLAATGISQAARAGKLFWKDFLTTGIAKENIIIFSSPFSRTKQTVEQVVKVLELQEIKPQVTFLDDLRERYFGPGMELKGDQLYSEIWNLDAHDPMTGPRDGESAADVAKRVARVIEVIESEVQGYAVLIVSHGDPLQILQALLYEALRDVGRGDSLLARLNGAIDHCILVHHRKFALNTGELQRVASDSAFKIGFFPDSMKWV